MSLFFRVLTLRVFIDLRGSAQSSSAVNDISVDENDVMLYIVMHVCKATLEVSLA